MKVFKKVFIFLILLLFSLVPTVLVNAATIDFASYEYNYDYLKPVVGTYYDSLDLSLDYDEFSDALHDLITANYKHYTYDDVSKILHISDMDPENSENVIGIYTGLSLSGGWNREHVWCKSHGFSGVETSNPYTDAHHLRAANAVVNSTRNNSDFGEVDHKTASSDIYGNYWTDTVYEPRDEVKGDCARMIFYVAIRYRNTEPFNAKIIEGSSLDYYKTTYADPEKPKDSGLQENGDTVFGFLSTLLKWSAEDPVSEEEIYRNNVVYDFQKNRNPFIDHPEYIEKCFDVSGVEGYNVDTYLNNSEVNSLSNLIDSIPDTISLSDEVLVNNCHNAYKALNNNEKLSLNNSKYTKLMNAIKEIRSLNNLKKNSGNVKVIDFNDTVVGGQSSYLSDVSATLNGVNVYFSHAHHMRACYADQISLGSNAKQTLDTTMFPFVNSDYGDYFKVVTPQKNVRKIEFYCPALYRSASYMSGWYIAYGDSENGYTKIASGTKFNYLMSVDLAKPISGEIVFIITGSTSAISFGTLTLTYQPEDSIKDIMSLDTKTSIAYSYEHLLDQTVSMKLPNEVTSILNSQNNASVIGLDSNLFNLSLIKGSSSTSNATTSEVRLYKGDTLKLKINGGVINSLTLNSGGSSYNATSNGTYSTDGENYNSISSYKIEVNSDTLYIKALNGQIRFSKFDINCDYYSYDNLKMRFGAVIDSSLYKSLIENHNVSGYGVFLAKASKVDDLKSTVQNAIISVDSENSLDSLLTSAYVNYEARRMKEDDTLYAFYTNDGVNEVEGGDYVMFYAYIPLNMANARTNLRAIAYLIVDGEYVFLGERCESFTSIAGLYIESKKYCGSTLSSLEALVE